MRTSRLSGLWVLFSAWCVAGWAEPVETAIRVAPTGGQTETEISWTAEPDGFYDIWTCTNLLDQGDWVRATEYPVIPSNLAATVSLSWPDSCRFFYVTPRDSQGPVVTARYPASGDANVGQTGLLRIEVSDPSGIDTNAFRLSINGGVLLTNGSLGVTVTTNGFTFDPALAAMTWGGYGATVTVAFACADRNGNPTSEEWSFFVQRPISVAENILVLGATAPQSYAVVKPKATMGVQTLGVKPTIGPLESGLAIVAIYSNRVVLSYTGDSHGVAVGALLANNDFDNIFYRKVTGLSDNPASKRVTVFTEDVPFTHLITVGSLDSGDFVWVRGDGTVSQGQVSGGPSTLDVFEKTLTYSATGEYVVGMDWGPVSFDGSASYSLTGELFFSTEILGLKVTQISMGMNANLDVALSAAVTFDATTEPVDESMPLLDQSLRLGKATAYVWGIPVRVSLYLDFDLCVESESSGSVTLSATASANAYFNCRVNYNKTNQWTKTSDGGFSYDLPPVTLNGGMEGSAYVYVKPTLTIRLYEAVGVAVDYRRGPMVKGAFLPSDSRYEFGLYDKRSVNLGLWCADLPPFLDGLIDPDNLPSWELWSKETPVRTWYWPEVPLSAPAFTRQPVGGTFANGASVALTVSASGNPAPTYQWYKDGQLLVGRTSQTLSFTMGSSAVGSYVCGAANDRGTATSSAASVTVQASSNAAGLYMVIDLAGGPSAGSYPVTYLNSVPAGGWSDAYKTTKLVMRRIPHGAFTMGSPTDELGHDSDETQRQVTMTKDFYIGVFEVTQKQWELVIGNRPSYFNNSTYYATRPVEQVSRYEIRENPNNSAISPNWPQSSQVHADSFMGKLRAKTGLSSLDLPTEAQWEYACRAGTTTALNSGYNLTSEYSDDPQMDVVGRYWYNGGSGFSQGCVPSAGTATVGSYPANAWGLYDMHGNVWEWCLDWYEAFHAPTTDPVGAASGSGRVLRGGGWIFYAEFCRSAVRGYCWPDLRYDDLGFRLSRTLP